MNEKTVDTREPLLAVENIKVYFPVYNKKLIKKKIGDVRAVDGVSLQIRKGETFGLVGESGCGKSTLGRAILRLYSQTQGTIRFEGRDITNIQGDELRRMRSDMQLIFQDPYSSLDPRMTVFNIIAEPLLLHNKCTRQELDGRVKELMHVVGLPESTATRRPSEFSGGQRQRIGIARALALNPKLIICDEPVSALDVSIQSQILNLLSDLQKQYDLTYLFIAHGLAVVKHISDNIGVMYLGRLVEISPKAELYTNPMHPYTKGLLSAIPEPDPEAEKKQILLSGEVPSPINPPSGCPFHPRCLYAKQCGGRCETEVPKLVEVTPGHMAACHLYPAE